MKISELPRLDNVRQDAEIPVAVEGENYNITIGQITKELSDGVLVRFSGILSPRPANVVFGTGTASSGFVIYDKQDEKFYAVTTQTTSVAGQPVMTWYFFNDFEEYDFFYADDGNVRTDCIFIDSNGRMFMFKGGTLISVGITDAQAEQLKHATPIEVASEEEMQQRIALGEYEEGQLYFLAESE